VTRPRKRKYLELTVLDALALAALRREDLVARAAAAIRHESLHSPPIDTLRLARMLFEDAQERGRFLLDIEHEVERQRQLHGRRRQLRAQCTSPDLAERRRIVGETSFGHPASWLWSFGQLDKAKNVAPFLLYHWISLYRPDVVIAGLSISAGAFRADAFVYKALRAPTAKCVVVPIATRDLSALFELLGLHRRTITLAKVDVDWRHQTFKINGRDTVPWNYT